MNIYLASSWRNARQPAVLAALREAGHEVYDFRNPAPGNNGFGWKLCDPRPPAEWSVPDYLKVLAHPVAQQGFNFDMDALRACDACVLVLPCGRSAHLELGWAAGAGKRTIVLCEKLDEPELMYLMCEGIAGSVEEVITALALAPAAAPTTTGALGREAPSETWVNVERPGYFGRRRDEKVAALNAKYPKWRLAWVVNGRAIEFDEACRTQYERSYFEWLKDRPDEVDFICSHSEVIDNAPTNIESGLDYLKQEAFSTHIQDIAIRNVISRLGRGFSGDKLLVVRELTSNGARFNPGRIPFYDRSLIGSPSLAPKWADAGSVEDFWQSNKWLQIVPAESVQGNARDGYHCGPPPDGRSVDEHLAELAATPAAPQGGQAETPQATGALGHKPLCNALVGPSGSPHCSCGALPSGSTWTTVYVQGLERDPAEVVLPLKLRRHQCMRCHVEVDCPVPATCTAKYMVLPASIGHTDCTLCCPPSSATPTEGPTGSAPSAPEEGP